MFEVKAGTTIQVYHTVFGNYDDKHIGWKPFVTKENKIYEKEEVFDIVALHNRPNTVPAWMRYGIMNEGVTFIVRNGKCAKVTSRDIEYID